jgi:CheY-like chemotaxis protein
LPNVAVLFTSGYTQNAIVHGGRLDPGVELLAKPYRREALARKIRHVLANHAQRRVTARISNHSITRDPLKDTTVLLVEDDELIRSTTKEMVSDLGCRVREASTAEDALKMLNEAGVDILLTDVGLPGASGLDLVKEASVRHADLALVLATGDSGVRAEAAKVNATLVMKPYTPNALRQALENALQDRKPRSSVESRR